MLGEHRVGCCWSPKFFLGIAKRKAGEVGGNSQAWGEPCVAFREVGASLVTGRTEGSSSGCDIARLGFRQIGFEDGREGETSGQAGGYSSRTPELGLR